jgi:hypothetical protein
MLAIVGQEDRLLVGDAGRHRVQRGVGVRDPDRLGLRPVDQVAEIQPIPPTVWQCDGMPRWQYSQRPHFVMAGTRTRSPV